METEAEKEAKRISELLSGINKAAFARQHKFPGGASMISQHCSGHRAIGLKAATIYARGLGVEISAFSPRLAAAVKSAFNAASKDKDEVDLSAHPELAAVRRIKRKIVSAPDALSEEDAPPIFFRRDWLAARGFLAENLLALRIIGRSMEPGMTEGDLVVVNCAEIVPQNGQVFAAVHEGEVIIRRMRRDAGNWLLESDNCNQIRYKSMICTKETKIIGKVVQKQSEDI
ncbi:MAG: S24 family peptidase [Zoogloeaceae bacterium]|jgi:phage repressor protein C with HTH and peptisase S24 domain|nr:S24 family peptidase [Zoogloeaceae bacterium]